VQRLVGPLLMSLNRRLPRHQPTLSQAETYQPPKPKTCGRAEKPCPQETQNPRQSRKAGPTTNPNVAKPRQSRNASNPHFKTPRFHRSKRGGPTTKLTRRRKPKRRELATKAQAVGGRVQRLVSPQLDGFAPVLYADAKPLENCCCCQISCNHNNDR